MAGYVRNDVTDQIANGNTVDAVPLDGEFDAVQAAFAAVGGHRHNGSVGEGAPITVIGPAQDVVASANSLTPKTDNAIDLGSSSFEWKDLYIDGIANIDSLVADTADINGGTIDGAVIGGASPAVITGTTVTATDLVATTATVGGVAVTTNTATQTLTNKTINLASNTLVATSAQLAASVSDETGSGALVFAASPALSGVPTAPTAVAGTNTTQIATTAHVFAERSNAATLTNKTLTSPTINGGTISGITDLAIADGGTGASTAADALINFGLTATAAELNQLDNNTFSGDITIDDKIVHAGDTNTAIRFPAADTVGIETAGAERFRVSSDGNISVGTTSTFYPAANRTTLSINGVNQSMVAFGAGGVQKGYMFMDGSSIVFGSDAGSMTFTVTSPEPMTFNTNNTERLRITSAGNVGIGTASPTATLHVDGTVAGTAIASQVEAEAGTATNKLMTPERTKQAIDALGGGTVLLGTVNTTSGSVQTLSGLDLTPYKQVQAWINGVDPSTTATGSNITVGGLILLPSGVVTSSMENGYMLFDLGTGRGYAINREEDRQVVSTHTLTTSSTSISVSTTQTFAAGSVTFYGVK